MSSTMMKIKLGNLGVASAWRTRKEPSERNTLGRRLVIVFIWKRKTSLLTTKWMRSRRRFLFRLRDDTVHFTAVDRLEVSAGGVGQQFLGQA